MKHPFIVILYMFCPFIFGLSNIVFHEWSDWNLGLLMAQHNDTDLYKAINEGSDMAVFSSLYGCTKQGEWRLLQLVVLIFSSGIYTTKLVIELFNKKVEKMTLVILIIVWLIKIPVPLTYSTLPSIASFLFALY